LASARQRTLDAEAPEGHDGPLRLCAATRLARPLDELIRFVAAPDGSLVPDLARELPGRGVWVLAEKQAVDAAVKQRVFDKSLKRQLKVPRELSSQVEDLLLKRAIGALALANKAGLVTTGFAQVEEALEKQPILALVHGADAAAGGSLRLTRKFTAISSASGRRPRVIDILSVEQMSLAIGRPNVVHAALEHGGAAEKFLSEAERLARYRRGISALTTSASTTHDALET